MVCPREPIQSLHAALSRRNSKCGYARSSIFPTAITPRDPNQLAKSNIDIATGQKPDRDPTPEEQGQERDRRDKRQQRRQVAGSDPDTRTANRNRQTQTSWLPSPSDPSIRRIGRR